MPFEVITRVTVMPKDDQARVQLLRAIRSSGLPKKDLLDPVEIACQRRSRCVRRHLRRRLAPER